MCQETTGSGLGGQVNQGAIQRGGGADAWEVHAHMTAASLELWVRLCRVRTIHGRGSTALAYLENSEFLPVGYRG